MIVMENEKRVTLDAVISARLKLFIINFVTYSLQ